MSRSATIGHTRCPRTGAMVRPGPCAAVDAAAGTWVDSLAAAGFDRLSGVRGDAVTGVRGDPAARAAEAGAGAGGVDPVVGVDVVGVAAGGSLHMAGSIVVRLRHRL
ncbi:MAG: hypothetical protein ACE5E6_07260 [Phycisphaerae bacterium]